MTGVLRASANLQLVRAGVDDRRWLFQIINVGFTTSKTCCVQVIEGRQIGRRTSHQFAAFGEADDDVVDVETFEVVVLSLPFGVDAVSVAELSECLAGQTGFVDFTSSRKIEPKYDRGFGGELRQVDASLPPVARVEQFLNRRSVVVHGVRQEFGQFCRQDSVVGRDQIPTPAAVRRREHPSAVPHAGKTLRL